MRRARLVLLAALLLVGIVAFFLRARQPALEGKKLGDIGGEAWGHWGRVLTFRHLGLAEERLEGCLRGWHAHYASNGLADAFIGATSAKPSSARTPTARVRRPAAGTVNIAPSPSCPNDKT